ncbi:FAD-dependent oxidoreductase [Thermopolyspora sp. NPDC052614]|uniref:NAD(P)/FAD-dependent oxidoreductase n=1 Tax=Thermopolyspora sp. NPDC052614 TaxID=3155682 RepID=UPI00342B64BF
MHRRILSNVTSYINAGVMGAAMAAELARNGCSVTVVDAGAPASGTSGATFSWTDSNGKTPRSYHDLNVEGLRAHRRLAQDVASCDWYHEHDNLEWKADPAERQDQQRKIDRLTDRGYPVRWLEPSQLRELEPDLATDMIDGPVAYYPEEGWGDPVPLVRALLASARSAGAEVRTHSTVVEMSMTGDRVTGVTTADGETVRTDAVVDCAGPRAAEVAALAGVELPMRNSVGLLAYTAPTAVTVGRVIHSPGVNLRPDGAGRLLLHDPSLDDAVSRREDGSWDVEPGVAETLLRRTEELYPGIRGTKIEATRVGVRPMPIDGLPVLGRCATVDGLYFAITDSGVTLCLRVAELVGAAIRGERVDELEPFRHGRPDSSSQADRPQQAATATPQGAS